MVEALPSFVIVVTHMPFADHGGAVTSGLKVFGIESSSCGDGALVIDDLVTVHELSGQNGGPAWRTERCRDKGILEMGTGCGHAVKIWSFEKIRGFLHKAHEVVSMIIAQDDDDVGSFSSEG